MNRRTFVRKVSQALLFSGVVKAGGAHAIGAPSPQRAGYDNGVSSGRAMGPLRVHPYNPRYFTDGSGKAIFLTGSHTWANLQDAGIDMTDAFDWKGYLNLLESHNHNFFRLWQWEQAAWAPWTKDKVVYKPNVYQRTGPGLAGDGLLKFDLERFNTEYFKRMRARISEAGEKGMYVAVQLFQGFSIRRSDSCGNPWRAHPFSKENNINGLDGDINGDSMTDSDNARVREMQEAYIRRVVEAVNDLDNVLYEVCNECSRANSSREWEWWVVDTIRRLERAKGKLHPIGLTGFGPESVTEMLASSCDWISPDARDGRPFLTDPPKWDGRKVSIVDTDHLWGHGGTVGWAWKCFTRGHNTLLMDSWVPIPGEENCQALNWAAQPGAPRRNLNRNEDPTWEPIRRAIGNTRYYAQRMDLVNALPSDEIASTEYCLAKLGHEYLVFLPEGDQVTLDLGGATGDLNVEWMDPIEGTIVPGGMVRGGGSGVVFKVPFLGPATLYVSKGAGAGQ